VSRDALVLVDHRDGIPEPVTDQLISQAEGCVTSAGGDVSALVLCDEGSGVPQRLNGAGLRTIYVIEGPLFATYNPEAFGKAAAEAVRRLEPGLFVCGHTFQGMEIAPFVATTLDLPLLPNCLELWIEGDDLVAERPVYGQSWQTRLTLPWQGTVIVSLGRRGGSPRRETGSGGSRLERIEIEPSSLGIRTIATELIRPVEGEVDVSRAPVVVGVGRGIRDPSNLSMVEDLAEALGGVVACSRPLVDLEWMAYERQVGASGKTIRPRVYIACGISGAAQHVAGITESEVVIAINQDPNAPIFRVAHHGAVADLLQVVPELTAEARRRRGRPAS
jgi:electron transfer flavoprotein alpha subunit